MKYRKPRPFWRPSCAWPLPSIDAGAASDKSVGNACSTSKVIKNELIDIQVLYERQYCAIILKQSRHSHKVHVYVLHVYRKRHKCEFLICDI